MAKVRRRVEERRNDLTILNPILDDLRSVCSIVNSTGYMFLYSYGVLAGS